MENGLFHGRTDDIYDGTQNSSHNNHLVTMKETKFTLAHAHKNMQKEEKNITKLPKRVKVLPISERQKKKARKYSCTGRAPEPSFDTFKN